MKNASALVLEAIAAVIAQHYPESAGSEDGAEREVDGVQVGDPARNEATADDDKSGCEHSGGLALWYAAKPAIKSQATPLIASPANGHNVERLRVVAVVVVPRRSGAVNARLRICTGQQAFAFGLDDLPDSGGSLGGMFGAASQAQAALWEPSVGAAPAANACDLHSGHLRFFGRHGVQQRFDFAGAGLGDVVKPKLLHRRARHTSCVRKFKNPFPGKLLQLGAERLDGSDWLIHVWIVIHLWTEHQPFFRPFRDNPIGEYPRMENPDETTCRLILGDNLSRLMKSRPELDSNPKLQDKSGVGLATISRIIHGQTAATLDTLEELAKAFGLQSWQLLVPGLDPLSPQMLASAKEAKMYESMRALVAQTEVPAPGVAGYKKITPIPAKKHPSMKKRGT